MFFLEYLYLWSAHCQKGRECNSLTSKLSISNNFVKQHRIDFFHWGLNRQFSACGEIDNQKPSFFACVRTLIAQKCICQVISRYSNSNVCVATSLISLITVFTDGFPLSQDYAIWKSLILIVSLENWLTGKTKKFYETCHISISIFKFHQRILLHLFHQDLNRQLFTSRDKMILKTRIFPPM